MELLLELRVGVGEGSARVDCRVSADPDVTVADLADALAAHASERDLDVDPGAVLWDDRGRRLPAGERARTVGIRSGSRLWLSVDPSPEAAVPTELEISVAGPFAVGPRVVPPGRHVIGSSADADIRLDDPAAPDVLAVIDVHDDGDVEVSAGDGSRWALEAVDLAGVGRSVGIGSSTVRLRPARAEDGVDASGGVLFNPTPHRPVPVRPRVLGPLPPPPMPTSTNRVALTAFLVPMASGVGFAVVFGRPQFLVIALLAPVVLLAVGAFERRRGRTSSRRARADYEDLVDEALVAGERALRDEAADRAQAMPGLDELSLAARMRRPPLWARDASAPDLLVVRLGSGSDRSAVQVEIGPGGDDELRAEVSGRIAAALGEIHDVPVGIDLDRVAVVGIHAAGAGDLAAREVATGLARSMLGQIVASHGPDDVVVAGLLGPGVLWEFESMRWLPHVRSAASPVGGEHLALWPDSCARLLGSLLDVAAARAADAPSKAGAQTPRIVVVVHEDAPVDRAALGRLLDLAPTTGVRVIWVGSSPDLVPRQCRSIVAVAPGAGRTTISATDATVAPRILTVETASVAAFDDLARSIAPLRDVSSVARTGAIARAVGLADVVGPHLGGLDRDSVAAAWASSDGVSLAAPVGIGPDGGFVIDLVGHGPHALIAGTSGSGKSELLQSLVAAMAACHPPTRVTFLFIDYKGGAAAAPFAHLPHQVGVVTNLDAAMSRRALTSLRAELDRRMALIADHDDPAVKDIADLAKVAPDTCPPRLVLVVDEFATLVKEIPDFVAGVVDVAQRGRSLGIHLVLATQRPAGAVNENILANTNLRIALRVVDTADSQSVIGTGEAADIPVPLRGRGFARIGPTELVPFQAAWSGAPLADGTAARVEVRPFGFEHAAPIEAISGTAVGSQFDAVHDAIADAFAASSLDPPQRPWLPPLADVVSLEAVEVARDPVDAGRIAVLGVRDEPQRQRRQAATVDLEASGGLAVFGSGGSGRSTALRTIAASLIRGATSDEVQLIGLDFAGRSLLSLLHLPHTRLVAGADDLDSVARIIDLLVAEIARRRTRLGEESAETLGALRTRTGQPTMPRLVVLIDGFGSLRAELDRPTSFEWLHRLQRVILDGRSVGIHVVLTADRRADVPSAALGAVGARLVLRMSDADAMAGLGVPLALARGSDLPAGRGFLDGDHEVQVAVVGGDPSAAAQASALAGWVPPGTAPAPRDVPLPDEVARPVVPDPGLRVTLGVAEGGSPASVDLGAGHLLVVGPPGSGRSTALAAAIDALHHPVERPVRIVIVARTDSPVAEFGRNCGLDVAAVADDQIAVLDGVLADVGPEVRSPATVVVVDDADGLDDRVARQLEQVAGLAGVRVVAGADRADIARAFSGWVPVVRRGRRMVILQPDDAAEVDQLASVRMRFRPGSRFPPGRGVLVVDRRPAIVQIGRPPVDAEKTENA